MDLLTCGPAAELTLALLVWWLLPRRFLYAHRDAKNDTINLKELIYGTRAARGNTSVSYSCKGTISWQLGQLITMFVPHITRKSGSLQKAL